MSNSFINELLKKKAGEQIEFLPDFDVQQILKAVCSFLNRNGGWVLVGFNREKAKVLGISDWKENKINELNEAINSRIFPQPLVYVQGDLYENKNVILLNVLKGPRPPYSLDKKYYVRSDHHFREANPDDISLLLRSSNEYASAWEKLTTIDATFGDLDEKEINLSISTANARSKGKNLPESPNEFLSYFQLSDYNSVKNGAVVLFGKKPTGFFAQCRIRITVLPSGKTGNRYDDTHSIEDNLFASFDQVQDYFKRNLPVISEFKSDNWSRNDRVKYPLEAIDEAIINAMVHRDYGDMSGEITINIYKDKIEIINSGEIPPHILKGKSIILPHHSIFRNPTIAHMFYLRGKMEKLGRGLAMIKERFSEFGLPNPEWLSEGGYTTLTLFGAPKPVEITSRMLSFLNHIKPEQKFDSADYVSFFKEDIKQRTATNDIQKLIDGGWLNKIGKGPETKYYRTNKKLPDIAG